MIACHRHEVRMRIVQPLSSGLFTAIPDAAMVSRFNLLALCVSSLLNGRAALIRSTVDSPFRVELSVVWSAQSGDINSPKSL